MASKAAAMILVVLGVAAVLGTASLVQFSRCFMNEGQVAATAELDVDYSALHALAGTRGIVHHPITTGVEFSHPDLDAIWEPGDYRLGAISWSKGNASYSLDLSAPDGIARVRGGVTWDPESGIPWAEWTGLPPWADPLLDAFLQDVSSLGASGRARVIQEMHGNHTFPWQGVPVLLENLTLEKSWSRHHVPEEVHRTGSAPVNGFTLDFGDWYFRFGGGWIEVRPIPGWENVTLTVNPEDNAGLGWDSYDSSPTRSFTDGDAARAMRDLGADGTAGRVRFHARHSCP